MASLPKLLGLFRLRHVSFDERLFLTPPVCIPTGGWVSKEITPLPPSVIHLKSCASFCSNQGEVSQSWHVTPKTDFEWFIALMRIPWLVSYYFCLCVINKKLFCNRCCFIFNKKKSKEKKNNLRIVTANWFSQAILMKLWAKPFKSLVLKARSSKSCRNWKAMLSTTISLTCD